MYKVLGVVDDKYRLLDTESGEEELATAEELVLGISYGQEFDGCKYGHRGLIVWWDGQEPYDVDVEVWKPVVCSIDDVLIRVDAYEVSNLGRVRSIDRVGYDGRSLKGRILRPCVAHRYLSIVLCIDGVGHTKSVHKLVAIAFIKNPNNLPMINHKDEISTNNFASNLEWCTSRYNNVYGSRIRRIVEARAYPIRQYSYYGELIQEFACTSDAAKVVGCSAGNLRDCCTGVINRACGFIWRYSQSDELFELSQSERLLIISNCVLGIRQYDKDYNFVSEYAGVKLAERISGFNRDSIRRCCKRTQQTVGGYIWRYITDDEFSDIPENAKAIEEFRKSMQR